MRRKYFITLIGLISVVELKTVKEILLSKSDGFYFDFINDKLDIKLTFYTYELDYVDNIYLMFEHVKTYKLTLLKNKTNKAV